MLQTRRVLVFLILTFSLTWGFELLVALTIGQAAFYQTGMNPLGMFFPACAALFLQISIFKDSPIYFRTYTARPRWIFYSFFLVTALYSLPTLLVLTTSVRPMILQGIGGIIVMLWTLLLLFLHGQCSQESLQKAGLQLGDKDRSVRFILGLALFLLAQSLLNWVFGLGKFPGVKEAIAGIPVPSGLYPLGLVIFFLISLIGTPLSGLAVVFGEEYAWRGYLQNELVKLGNQRGVFLVGLIWGIWHFPVILSGVHTYQPTLPGFGLAMIFFVLAGFVWGYAVLKIGSIWVAVFMHGVLNSLYAFGLTYLIYPDNKVFSFGLGIYGLLFLAVVVGLILRDPVWRGQPLPTEK